MKVAEIFESISGEIGGFTQGSPCTFIRLAGCNLNCPFCDTAWAISPDRGFDMEVEEIVEQVDEFPWNQILITGGEPLVQKEELQQLINRLKFYGYEIQIETNGTLEIHDVYLVDYWVIDFKGKDAMRGVPYEFSPGALLNNCWIKYLAGSMEDVEDAITTAKYWKDKGKCRFAISVLDGTPKGEVVQRILASKIPIVLNLQIHKMIGAR